MRSSTYDISLDPLRGRLRRAVMSYLGLLLIIFNVIAGLALSARDANGLSELLRQDAAASFIICSSGSTTEESQSSAQGSGTRSASHAICIFCLPLMKGFISSLTIAYVTLPRCSRQNVTISTSDLIRSSTFVAAFSARGPPSI